MLAEMEALTLGDALSDGHALIDALNDTLAEVERDITVDALDDAQTLVDTLADSLPQVEVVTLRDTLGMRRHWSTRWLTRKHRWRQRR